MHIGTVFSQADSGTDAVAIREWAVRAEEAGFHHIMAYDHILGATLERLGPGPFGIFPTPAYTIDHTFHEILTLFAHLAGVTSTIEFVSSVIVDSWKPEAATAAELDYDYLTVGFNRVAISGRSHDEHLDVVIDTIGEIKAFMGHA